MNAHRPAGLAVRRLAWALCLASIGAGGCQAPGGGAGGGTASMVPAASDPVVADLPRPSRFALVEADCVFWQAGRYRAGKLVYSGPASATAIKRFYEEQMPTAGFDKRELTLYGGTYLVRFESETEVCNIRIRDTAMGRARVEVEIVPLPQGTTERALPRSNGRPPTQRPPTRP